MPNALDQSILRDKRVCSRGRAKIFLRHLRYHSTSSRGQVHESHVDHLLSVFRREGCIRLHTPEHYVPAIISREDLKRTLRYSQLRIGHLTQEGDPVLLSIPEDVDITVLHGEHRLRAAERYLDPTERWWVVELYLSDLQETTKRLIQEEYAHQLRFSDGDVYRKIRYYQRHGNNAQVEKWKARLSYGKLRYLKLLERGFNSSIRQGFDRLLPFSGLWGEFELGALTHTLHLRCPEEFGYYLKKVHKTWRFVLGDEDLFSLLDPDTVCSLETLAPESTYDAALIAEMMDEGRLFQAISEPLLRNKIKRQLLQLSGRILSLRTFFDDTKCMEAWVISLRPLLPSITKGTTFSVREAFFHCYEPTNPTTVHTQVAGGKFQETNGTPVECRNLAYLMIFLTAMRNFPVLSRKAPHHERGKKKPIVDGSVEEYQSHLALVAMKLGFRSPEILELTKKNPDAVAVQSFLRRVRPPQQWEINDSRLSSLTELILGELGRLAVRRDRSTRPRFTHERGPVPKKLRCGLPDNSSYEADKDYLYIDDFHDYNTSYGSHLTSLAFQRDIFLGFFGDIFHSSVQMSASTPESDPPGSPGSQYDLNMLFVESNAEDSEPAPSPSIDMSEGRLAPRRDTSSDYEDASSMPTSRPATHIPDYTKLLEASDSYSQDRVETFPRATGFESTEALSMYSFHILQNEERLSIIVDQFLSSDSVLVLYNWSTRHYAKFEDLPGDHIIFRSQAITLADKGYKFICFKNGKASPLIVATMWEDLKKHKLVLAGRDLSYLDAAQWSRDKFLQTIDRSAIRQG